MEKVKRSGRNLQQSQSTGLGFFLVFIYLLIWPRWVLARGIFHCISTDSPAQ